MSDNRPTVLIVEDDPLTALSLSRLIEPAGYRVAAFNAALPALAHVENAPIDAAVLDIHLPDLNGLVLSRRLRDVIGPDKPIIILSGDTSMENLNALSLVGATYFLAKPVNTDHLLDRLRELMHK